MVNYHYKAYNLASMFTYVLRHVKVLIITQKQSLNVHLSFLNHTIKYIYCAYFLCYKIVAFCEMFFKYLPVNLNIVFNVFYSYSIN